MSASDAVLRDLRASLARIERGTGGDATLPPISLTPPIDDHLPGGGLARGALHEVQASDLGAGLALCTLILSRTDGPVLWISAHAEGVWAPGLHALGLRADRLLQASYRQPADGLWTMEEALRSPALGGAVLQMDRLDMTASRRLQLAAEGSPRVGLLLRNVAEHGPSSAVSRWRVASLADAAAHHAGGWTCFAAAPDGQAAGMSAGMKVRWRSRRPPSQNTREPPLPGPVPALPPSGPAATPAS